MTIGTKFLFKIMSVCPHGKRAICQDEKKGNIASLSEIHRFVTECLDKLAVKKENAAIFADLLIAADSRGIYSHGLNRLEHYINDIKGKNCDANAVPVIDMEYPSTAAVCGNNGLGAVIGTFCMDLALKKAKKTGIGLVVAKGSNHFGINMFYSERACKQGFIGLVFTNTSPVMVPTGAKNVCLGTDPLSICAPGQCNDSLIVDISSTAVSVGKIEMYKRRKQSIPLGWALDENGKATADPEIAMKNRKLMPLGGDVSHKGTSLALMVECLSGLLANSAYGHHIRLWGSGPPQPANLGHGFIAIDPSKFPPGFQERLSDLLNYIRKLEPADPAKPVVVPGDIERDQLITVKKQGGIAYTPSHIEMVEKLSKQFDVKPIQFS